MSAETDIAAIDNGGANTAAEVRTALTSVLARADISPPYTLLTRTSSFQTLATAEETVLTWQNEVVDTLGAFDAGTSTSLLVAPVTGLYLASYHVYMADEASFNFVAGNYRQGRLAKNNTPDTSYPTNTFGRLRFVANDDDTSWSAFDLIPLAAADTLDLRILQTSGESLAMAGQRITLALLGNLAA